MNNDTDDAREYNILEIHSMIAKGEEQFTEGLWLDSEEMFRKMEDELADTSREPPQAT